MLEKTSQMIMTAKGLMYNSDKEANCRNIFMMFLSNFVNQQKILHGTVQIDFEFVVWENRQVGRNSATDAAMVVFYDENDQ